VRLRSAQRLRLACTSAASNMVVVVQTPRSKILPGPNAPQITGKGDVTWNVGGFARGLVRACSKQAYVCAASCAAPAGEG
jgi:hypothetical protein